MKKTHLVRTYWNGQAVLDPPSSVCGMYSRNYVLAFVDANPTCARCSRQCDPDIQRKKSLAYQRASRALRVIHQQEFQKLLREHSEALGL